MRETSIYFFYNPLSGSGTFQALVASLYKYANEIDILVKIEEINFNNLSLQIQQAFSAQTIVVCGGDGTLCTLLPLLSSHPRVGIFPLGTGNDLARELGLKDLINETSASRIIKSFLELPTKKFSLFSISEPNNPENKINFCNYVSFGFDAQVIRSFSTIRKLLAHKKFYQGSLKKLINRFSYLLLFFKHFFSKGISLDSLKSNHKEIISSTSPCRSIIFANIQSYMGLGISNSKSNPSDKLIECISVGTPFTYLNMLLKLRLPFLKPTLLGSDNTWEISFGKKIPNIQIDGEARKDFNSSTFTITVGEEINLIYQA